MNRRDFTLSMLAAALSPTALAQSGVVKLVLPNAAGSGVDAITRALGPALSKQLNAPVVIENQPGAGGIVGLQTLARAAPDGMTLSIVSNNVVILPSVMKSMPFTMPGDFTPIAVLGETPMVLLVNPQKMPVKDAQEFFAMLKSKPRGYNYASSGNGTILHLAPELVLEAGGATATHVPYKGVGPMVTDLIGGQVDFAVAALPSVQGHIKSGALRPIGMLTSARTPAAPDIPTLAEQGLNGFAVQAWFGLLGPKNLPRPRCRKCTTRSRRRSRIPPSRRRWRSRATPST
jgi:tripartite-type tricarboxylate transporter receptor subunit TctC